MTSRVVLCEGKDDVKALREIATRLFGAFKDPQPPAEARKNERFAFLKLPNGTALKLVGDTQGKSGLPRSLAAWLHALALREGSSDTTWTTHVAVVYDPDGDSVEGFYGDLERNAARAAPAWTIERRESVAQSATWQARRETDETVAIRAIPWRADGDVLGGLADHQNLERVLCRVLAAAHPADVPLVADWLNTIQQRKGTVPRWKAAIHLWCALVDDKADAHTAAERFLGQYPPCKPHVEGVLQATGLYNELAWIFSSPPA